LEIDELLRQQVLPNMPVLVSMIQLLQEKLNLSMLAMFLVDLLNEYFLTRNLSDSLRWLLTGAVMRSFLSMMRARNGFICRSLWRRLATKQLNREGNF
jgi:hypothetical protein